MATFYLQTGTNSVVVTASEFNPPSLTQYYYTWELIRKGTFDSIIFYQDDISPAPDYWNQFIITVGTASGLTAGIIDANSGEYIYNIYRMDAPYVLDITGALLIETGICNVDATYTQDNSYTGTNNDNIKYYKNL